MKEFTTKACNAMDESGKTNTSSVAEKPKIEYTPSGDVAAPNKESFFFLPLIWNFMQDDAKVSPGIAEQALQSMIYLLQQPFCNSIRLQYLYLCMQNIKQLKSIYQSISLSHQIIISFKRQIPEIGLNLHEIIKEINIKFPFIDIIINSCQYYMKIVENTIIQSKLKTDILDTIFAGKHKHSQILKGIFSFMQSLLILGDANIKITKDHILKLWNTYVKECKVEYDTKEFLKWLSLEKESTINILPVCLFEKDINSYLFDLICKTNDKIVEENGLIFFKCFSKQFKLINIENNSIDIRRGRVKAVSFERMTGLDSVWEKVCRISGEQLRLKYCDLLVDIYLNVSEALQDKKVDFCKDFIDKAMKEIMKSDLEKEQLKIANLVKLILIFLEALDGKKYISNNETHSVFGQSIYTINVTFKPSN